MKLRLAIAFCLLALPSAFSPVVAKTKAGTNAEHATPTRLTIDTPLGVLMTIPEAKAVLEQQLPQIATSSAINQVWTQTPRSLARVAPQLMTDARLAALDRALAALPPMVISLHRANIWTMDSAFTFETVRLWDGPAPGALGTKEEDIPTLTIVRPNARPVGGTAVVLAPGGGYMGLALVLEGRQVADWLAARGVTVFILKYRLGSSHYLYPAPLQDARRAIRWVRTNAADYGIDPARIGMMGFSAGGHLTAMTETLFDAGDAQAADPVERASSRPDFAMLVYPGILQDRPGWTASAILPPQADEATRKAMSPADNVSARTPPTFIVHSTGDTLIPATDATRFYEAMRAAKVPGELHIFDGGRHGFGMGAMDGPIGAWPGLLDAWLHARGLLAPPPALP